MMTKRRRMVLCFGQGGKERACSLSCAMIKGAFRALLSSYERLKFGQKQTFDFCAPYEIGLETITKTASHGYVLCTRDRGERVRRGVRGIRANSALLSSYEPKSAVSVCGFWAALTLKWSIIWRIDSKRALDG